MKAHKLDTGCPNCEKLTEDVDTPVGGIAQVDTRLRLADHFGAWKMRWGIGRLRYRIAPGLYAVGRPGPESPVLVSANYKLSFDRLRCELSGVDAWILVLDTKGINVWCAAGKGTFGTDELVRRIEAAGLPEVVSHRTLVLPQLGAPGVAAHEVRKRSGFRVVYGPVRAADLPAFLAADMQATPEMRKVRFPLRDRVVLIPVELVQAAKYALLTAACLMFLAGWGLNGFSIPRMLGVGAASAALLLTVAVGSIALTAVLLPWLPGRALAVKGLWLGLAFTAGTAACEAFRPGLFGGWLSLAAWCLAIPAVASFLAMNFTGSTNYTSLSGVRREMRVAVPVQAACAGLGAVLWLVGRFV
jgi:hypothetical protein